MSSTTDNLAMQFSSTERRKGESLFEDGAVALSSTSDTFVSAFVRPSGRATLSASEVAGSSIVAKCTCQKGLCRHIWATLLRLESLNHDFLLGKDDISLASTKKVEDEEEASPKPEAVNVKQSEYAARQKVLAKEYRKQQSLKQKERRKQEAGSRTARNTRTPAFTYPSQVEEARSYFQANGFEMKQPIDLSEVVDAKKQLSRVFHPDKGGSHDEILELNRNFQILSDYLKS